MVRLYDLDSNNNIIRSNRLQVKQLFSDLIDGVRISTVFLSIDHNPYSFSAPELFETMIFGGNFDQYQQRYSTYDEAKEGHEYAKSIVLGGEERILMI